MHVHMQYSRHMYVYIDIHTIFVCLMLVDSKEKLFAHALVLDETWVT